MTKTIISAAPKLTGKTADEITKLAESFADNGAIFFKIDPRKGEQKRAVDLIRLKSGNKMLVQLSAESGGVYRPEQQMKLIMEFKPEAVLIPLVEFMPRPDYEIEAEEFFTWVKEHKILAQYVLYSPDELRYFLDLADQRIIPEGDDFVLFAPKKEPGNMAPFIKVMKEAKAKLNWVASVSNFTNAMNIINEGGGLEISDKAMLEKIAKEKVAFATLKNLKRLY